MKRTDLVEGQDYVIKTAGGWHRKGTYLGPDRRPGARDTYSRVQWDLASTGGEVVTSRVLNAELLEPWTDEYEARLAQEAATHAQQAQARAERGARLLAVVSALADWGIQATPHGLDQAVLDLDALEKVWQGLVAAQ